ncbi:mechanosensitive ion channel protein [Brevirhabdus pacifica]|uniref:Mechanosensitive ion channel protein n=1 Tax=Brevirhabdus pacifica TaxID=1267768 RepID=A0A1U7DJ49_9RHOB|nr:mechanosensitive ion channel domain-containing protein [Brevirhabdus pacifica]APX90012.1 mechanosensitive ion channel protein [Brevirhabdus pacifica]OWU75390.1 mechanosensitive ion channel protein [Loktanella sp. 22II-4b]PJJ82746.1 mechanosensitive ion channel-like protein [Brevirhabdus pacifica]
MNPEIPGLPDAVSDKAIGLWSQVEALLNDLLLPWRLYQLGIVVGIVLVAYLLRMVVAPRMHDWMRSLEGLAKWRMRVLVLLHRRIWLIATMLVAWGVVFVMRELTWPSRSYFVGLFATIVTAWFVVGLIARLIRNPLLRRVATWGAWIYVTLYYLELDDSFGRMLEGLALEFGEFRLTALAILKALVITALLFTGARLVSSATSNRIQGNEDLSPSMRVLAVKILQIVLYGAAFFIGLKSVGFDLTGLAVLSGAIGVGLGFGLQKVVSNLVSGVIILLDKSIKPGDVISLGETFGWINALTARYVSITTRDGKEYLIPNEDLITTQVVNWSHSNDYVRLDINFGAAYDDDPHDVRRLAIAAAKSVDRVLSIRPPVCHIVGFGDSSVDYVLRFWIRDPTEGLTNVRGGVFLALWDTFKENGINIPFPQREVRILGEIPKSPGVVLD